MHFSLSKRQSYSKTIFVCAVLSVKQSARTCIVTSSGVCSTFFVSIYEIGSCLLDSLLHALIVSFLTTDVFRKMSVTTNGGLCPLIIPPVYQKQTRPLANWIIQSNATFVVRGRAAISWWEFQTIFYTMVKTIHPMEWEELFKLVDHVIDNVWDIYV